MGGELGVHGGSVRSAAMRPEEDEAIAPPLGSWREAGGRLAELAAGLAAGGVEADRPTRALWVPGRVELLGKHTDYAGGRSLVAAIDRGLLLLAAPRWDSTVHWRDFGRGIEVQFDVSNPGRRPGHWSNYLLTPARRAAADHGAFSCGVDVAMTSTLPAAAGLSSSSALLVAAYLVFVASNRERPSRFVDRVRLASYLGAVESGTAFEGSSDGDGVGTFGGSEDHAAILCSEAHQATQFSFAPLAVERRVEWPVGWRLAVGCSGVRAKKTGGVKEAFNRLTGLAAEAASAVGRATGREVGDLGRALSVAGGVTELERLITRGAGGDSVQALWRRCRHFVVESEEVVPQGGGAVAAGDAAALGQATQRSQVAAEELLGNQIEETAALARLALATGARAATAFGAGFGGAVWALVPEPEAEPFLERWRAAYTAAFPQHLETSLFFVTAPAAGARWLSADSAEATPDAKS